MYSESNIKEITQRELDRAEKLLEEIKHPLKLEQSAYTTEGVSNKENEMLINECWSGMLIEKAMANFLLEAPEILRKCLKSIEAYRRQAEGDWETMMGDDL